MFLLQEYDMLFCETSAKSGRGVQESVRAMARCVFFHLIVVSTDMVVLSENKIL